MSIKYNARNCYLKWGQALLSGINNKMLYTKILLYIPFILSYFGIIIFFLLNFMAQLKRLVKLMMESLQKVSFACVKTAMKVLNVKLKSVELKGFTVLVTSASGSGH